MEAIGQLAAGIAHEINTPTQYVSDNAVFLRESWTTIERIVTVAARVNDEWSAGSLTTRTRDELAKCFTDGDIDYLANEIPRAIEETFDGARQVARIVRAMNEFAHPPGASKCACDLNRAIESTITVARNEWKYVARMETCLDPSLPLVECLPDRINQVVLNLIVNAAHAIGETIAKERAEGGAGGSPGLGTIRVETAFAAGWMEIRISDTGAGIPQEIRERIFEPFFTTKKRGKGTGQGLALAWEVIVEQHEGEIRVESEVGKGTTFVLRLPTKSERGHGDGEATPAGR
jgi:signal transduction histidine kinase